MFVIFLDTGNVGIPGAHDINGPIIELLTHILGPDDLVGLMTPDMSPTQITFVRKTQAIEQGLRKNWAWGRKSTLKLDDAGTEVRHVLRQPGAEGRGRSSRGAANASRSTACAI